MSNTNPPTSAPRWQVLCVWDTGLDRDTIGTRLPTLADVTWRAPQRDWVLENIHRYDAYLATLHMRVDKAFLDRATRLKIIATPTTGLDHLDLDEIEARGIHLISIKTEYGLLDRVTATAEMAWGLMLAAVRKIPAAATAANAGVWARDRFRGMQISGKTLGILGVGRLGKMVADYGNAFRMRVIGCDVQPITKPGVEQVDFETLLREADILTIHIHLNETTRHLIGAAEFAKMKDGVVIVNTSRGGIIDEQAFEQALLTGKVGAAGLDVIEGEWRDDLESHPLIQYARSHDNVVIVPHLGGITKESQTMSHVFLSDKLADALAQLDPTAAGQPR